MAPVDPSELLAHAAWLRRLARSLAHEGADDIIQDTWLAALRRPPERAHSMRPWLRKVLTNATRMRWRSDESRTARERVAVVVDEPAVPTSEELLERHELQQMLARLVGELEEPFRSTILLRFAEALTPTQIARRLGIPAGTVRWRLKEALERLRARLDAEHHGNRRTWMLALGPFARPRSVPATPILPLVIACCAVCVVIGTVLLELGSATPPTNAERHIASAPRARVTPAASIPAASWLAQEGVAPRPLMGRVVDVDGLPVPGAVVHLMADALPSRDLVTGRDGRFDFGEQLPREYSVSASMPGRLAAIRYVDLREPAATHDVELALGVCAASLYGRVIDASGTPLQGAQVLREGVVGTETDATGEYDLCALPTAALVAELRVVVRADGFGTLVMPIAPVGRLHRDFVLAPEASVSGRVVTADGSELANARVTLSLTPPEASAPPERGLMVSTLTDPEGEFRFAGLAAGEYMVRASSASSIAPPLTVAVEAADNRRIELRAVSTGIVRGRVVSHGSPMAGVTVSAASESAVSQADGSFVLARVPIGDVELETAPYRRTSRAIHVLEGDRNTAEVVVELLGTIRGTVRRHGVPVPFARVDIGGPSKAGVTTDASGRYEARGLEAGMYGFYCDDRRRTAMFTEDRVFELGPGQTREHDIELAWGGTIAGHVVDGHGAPVDGAMVWFRAAMSSHCLTDASGSFMCGGLAGDTYTATVLPSTGAANAFRFAAAPGTFMLRDGDARVDGVRLVIDPTLLAIDGRVVDAAGAPVRDVAVHAFGVERKPRFNFQMPPGTVTDDDGRFQFVDLSAGDYSLEAERHGLAAKRTVAAGTHAVTLVLDRSRCDAVGGHDLPTSLVRPPAPVVWDRTIELVGWSLPGEANVEGTARLTLVYRALRAVDRDWTIFAHFDSPSLRVNADHGPGDGWCPTNGWQAGETIVDRASVRFEHAGRYALTIGFFTGNAPAWENLAISTVPTAMEDTKQQGVHVADILVKE